MKRPRLSVRTRLISRLTLALGIVVVVGMHQTVLAQGEQAPSEIDWFELGLGVVGGLVLFLYGVSRLASALNDVASDRIRDLLARCTTNRFAGVATGAVATTVLDSSSVTIIMVITLVNAGLLTFVESLGVIMGSNIGTTMSSILFATNLDRFAALILLLGFGCYIVSTSERMKQIGLIVLSIGLVFFGLNVIGDAVEPLQEYQPFIDFMARVGENVWLGVLVGAVATMVIQSSSATLGIIITLASQGLVSLPAGIALMLGAEIGTCADTLIASIGRERPALRAGIFHLLFNAVTVLLGVMFASQLAQLAQVFIGGDSVERQIAAAQVLFNVLGVGVFIWFTPQIARVLELVIPDAASQKEPQPSAVT